MQMIDYFGGRLAVPAGHFDEANLLAGGVSEPGVVNVFGRLVRPGQTVLDIGANIGQHTMVLASLVGPTGKVYAVEADLDNVSLIRKALVDSRLQTIYLIAGAASDRAGLIHMLGSANSNTVFSEHSAASETKVACAFTIDSMINEPVDFVKIDIEGMELPALRGMCNIIDRYKPIIASEFSPLYMRNALGTDRSLEYLGFVQGSGYAIHLVEHGIMSEPVEVGAVLDAFYEGFKKDGTSHLDLALVPIGRTLPN